jgi:hypothetical protein
MSGDVVEYKVEVLQEFHPTGLPPCNLLWLTEILEVFVIHSNVNGVVHTEEVGATTLEAVDDGSHLFIVDVIVSFGR